MNYNKLSEHAHKTAVDRGLWEKDTKLEEKIMCIIMEVGKAVDAYRYDKRASKDDFEDDLYNTGLDVLYKVNYNMCIQNTVESAFANIVIRLLDLAGAMEVDFDEEGQDKKIFLVDFTTMKGIDFQAMSFLQTAYIFVTQYLTAHDYFSYEWGYAWLFMICLKYMEQWAKHLDINLEWFVKTRMDLNDKLVHKN